MSKPLIMVSSVTYAMKARELLYKYGLRGYVLRVPRTAETGCGYGVYVPDAEGFSDDAEQAGEAAVKILRENNIRILKRMEKDGDG